MHTNHTNRFGHTNRQEQTYRNFQALGFTDLADFYEANLPVLTGLLQKTVTDYWMLSDAQGQCRFNHVPIILIIDNTQFEFTAIEQKGYSVTINCIDLTSKHDWYALGRKIPLEWKRNYYQDINRLLGHQIVQVNVLGFSFNFNAEAGEYEAGDIKALARAGYHPYGIELEVGLPMQSTSYLCIFNALGKNSLIAHRLVRNKQLIRIPITTSR
jgi:hypothetical protein